MDPLSIAASVTGLIMAGAQITSLVQRLQDAPALASAVETEISHFVVVLSQLQPFLTGASHPPTLPSRSSLIEVQQIQIILSGSVITLSELQTAVAALSHGAGIGIRDRVRWMLAESAIAQLVQRVRDHKSSLTLILTLLTCQSTSEAMTNLSQLRVLLEHFIQHNTQLFHRVQDLENRSAPVATVTRTPVPSRLPFEQVLFQSELYRRALDPTAPPRRGASGNWSIASGMSLAQVPDICAMRIAVTPAELSNPECYAAAVQVQTAAFGSPEDTASVLRPVHRPSLSAWDTDLWELVKSGADKEAVYPGAYPAGQSISSTSAHIVGLYEACKHGAHHTVRDLLERGASLSNPNSAGDFALHVAARNGHFETVQVLLDGGADVRARNPIWDTALHLAAMNGHHAAVRVLLAHGAEIDAGNITRDSPLHLAAAHGHVKAVSALVSAGADMHAQREFGYRAVHVAATNGHHEVVVVLLRAGAGQETRNPYGRTPLHFAASTGQVRTVVELLKFGVDVDTRSNYGDSALHVAASHGDCTTIALLLESGADIEATNESRDRPLHVAVRSGKADSIRALLEAGADVDAENVMRKRPLHVAIDSGRKENVMLLFEFGVDMNVLDGCGRSTW